MSDEYHGLTTGGNKPVPPMPTGYKPQGGSKLLSRALQELNNKPAASLKLEDCQGLPGPSLGITYPYVRMTGNFGVNFCQQSQSIDYYNITSDEAHQYAWTAFGFCNHVILYFDSYPPGQPVAQDS